MRRLLPLFRAAVRSLPILALVLPACIAPSAPRTRTPDTSTFVPDPDVDPSRAYVPLLEIPPPIPKPSRPESLKPLSDRSVRQIAAARNLMDEQRYTEAAIELERALRYDPNHPEIHRALGALHWQAGNLQRAETHTERALRLNPDNAGAHSIIGRCRARRGDQNGAITAYRTALLCSDLDQNPETAALCHYRLAEALTAEGYLTAALAQYTVFEEKAASLDSAVREPELITLLQATGGAAGESKSRILEKLGRYADAADALAPLVSIDPTNMTRGVRFARLLMRAGKTERALVAAEALNSDNQDVIQLLTEIHERAGHPERVVDDLRSRMARRPGEPRLVLGLADALIRNERTAEAVAELQNHLREYPQAEGIRTKLIDLCIDRGEWERALQAGAERIRRQPDRIADTELRFLQLASDQHAVGQILGPPGGPTEDGVDPVVSYLRGVVARAAHRFEPAEFWLNDSLARQPDFIPARVALARVHLQTFQYDRAIQVAARAEEDLAEDARLEQILGRIYERLDDLERAELHFKAAVQLDRTDTESMLWLARVYRRSERFLQAQRQLRVLLEEDPRHEPAREMLAFSYLRDGKIDAAYEQFEVLNRFATTPLAKARYQALLDPFPPRDPEAYREALFAAIEKHGADASIWIDIAETHDQFAQAEQVREAYRNALALDPENEASIYGLVRVEQQLLDFEEAIRQLVPLLPRRPNRHAWRTLLIDLYWAIQDFDAALLVARAQEARNDIDERTRTRYRLRIVESLRLANRSDEAIQQLKVWSDAAPDNWEWGAILADAYLRRDQAAKAIPILEARYDANRDDLATLSALAGTLAASGQMERAQQYALDWLIDDPDNDAALALLVDVFEEAGRFDDALELLRNKLLHTLNRQVFQNRVIQLLRSAERHEAANAYIETLLDVLLKVVGEAGQPGFDGRPDTMTPEETRHYPNEPFSLLALHERLDELRLRFALGLFALKEYREAEGKLTSWLDASRDPETRSRLLRVLILCYQQQGNDDKANEMLERALLLEPGDVSLNNDLAYGWIDRGIRLDEAEPMIRYAVSRAPQQGAYLDTYGWLLYKKGDFAGAKKWLERARQALSDNDPVVLDHLGDTCWRLGRKEEAVEHWNHAVAVVNELGDDALTSTDARRVRDRTPQKIDDARAGNPPSVAPQAETALPEDPEAGAPSESSS